MKLIAVILCLALVNYADSDLLEMSQELWSRVLNGGFLRLGRIDPLRIPVIKVDQSEGDTSYRVLLRNLEVTGLNNSKIESVHIVRGRLNSNLSDNEAGYVSYNEARDADSIRYRFHTLIKEPKSNSEDRDLSASEQFEQFMFYDPADVRAGNEDDLVKAGTQNDQTRRYYNDFDPSLGVRRGYPAEQREDTVFQLYRQPNYGDMKVVMNPTPKKPSQVRVVYTHNYNQNAQGDLPRPCVGACRPNYASNVRAGAQNYQSQPQQYPYGAESRYYQDRVNYDEQSTTPAYGIKAQFGGNQQPQIGIKGGQKGGAQYSANFGGSPQQGEQTLNQFSIKGGNSGASYNGNYKTGPFAVNAQSQNNYGNTAQLQQQNQFSVKGSPSGVGYSVDYKKGPLSVQSQSNEGYGTTGYPQNQYSGYPEAGYTGNYKTGSISDNYGSTAQPPNQFEAKKGPGSGVSYAFDFRKGPVAIQTGNSYTSTGRPENQYSAKGSGYSTTKRPQNEFSVKGGSSGLDYSGHYNAGPFSVNAQSDDGYGTTGQPEDQYSAKGNNQGVKYGTAGQPQDQYSAKGNNQGVKYGNQYPSNTESGPYGQPQDQYSVKGNNQGVKYGNQYPSNIGSGPYGQRQNQFPVKGGNQYGGQNNANYGSASNNYEVKAQAGGARFSADNSGVRGQADNFGVNYSNNFNNGQFSVRAGNQRGQQNYEADQTTRYTEATTPQYYEEFEPYKSPIIRLEKQPSYVDIVYAPTSQSGTQPRSGKYSDPRQYGLRQPGSNAAYNYTEGVPLNYRNDAARHAGDTGRLNDLLRYAKQYQEEQGYYEEGMELVYHFGNLNDGKDNETLTRNKRQHSNATDEDDLMHVVVRLRIPQLGLKSNYALTGKVGQRQLRGGGQLSGNFTDVVADFTVELKRVDNRTMIVRAARAKLVSKDRKLRLQGMDENGPVASILSHGLMAAEAVAAMIADDLATKALNENNNAETMIYKMYKNLPVLERS